MSVAMGMFTNLLQPRIVRGRQGHSPGPAVSPWLSVQHLCLQRSVNQERQGHSPGSEISAAASGWPAPRTCLVHAGFVLLAFAFSVMIDILLPPEIVLMVVAGMHMRQPLQQRLRSFRATIIDRVLVLPAAAWGKLMPPDTSVTVASQVTASPPSGSKPKPVRKSFLKAPKAADLVPQVARTPQKTRVQRDAPIQVEIRKYTGDASLFSHTFPTEPMWQVQVVHTALPAVTYDLVRNMNDFLAEQHAVNQRIPASVAGLYADLHIKVVLTDGNDPDCVGFVPWRVAFYVAGSAPDRIDFIINLLDNFFAYRQRTEQQRAFPMLEAVYTVTTLAACTVAASDLEISSTLTQSDEFSFCFYEAAPPFGRRLICCVIDIEGSNISALISGNTYPFRTALDDADIGGDYGPADESGIRQYYRVLPSQSMDSFDLATLLATVFKDSLILCSVRTEIEPDTPAAAYVRSLKEKPHLSFIASDR